MLARQYVQQAAQQYRTAQVSTADPGRLLLMMYDGALRFAAQGRDAIEKGDVQGANGHIGRVQDIVAELMAALDMDAGDIAVHLLQMYDYIQSRLIEANVKKDPVPLAEAVDLLQQLRDTWAQAAEGDGGVGRDSNVG